MYVTSLSIDRFGARSNLRLEDLSEGLNVVYGPSGSGKASTVDFLRAMFGGFDGTLRERYLNHSSRGCGGSVAVHTATGRQTISRYDDGSRDGRLTVERPDGAVIGWRHLDDLLGNVPPSLLGKAYFVDFDRQPDLGDLLAEAAACGLFDSNRERDHERTRMAEHDLATGEQQIVVLKQKIAAIGRSLSDLEQRRQQLNSTSGASSLSLDSDRASVELRAIDAQLKRWRKTLRDIVQRKQRATEVSDDRPLKTARTVSPGKPRRILRSLEEHLHNLQATVDSLAPQADGACQCQSLHASLIDALHQLRQDVYEACNALSHRHSKSRRRRAVAERDQLSRCEAELRQTIRSLSRRRQSLQHRLSSTQPSFALHPDHHHLCQCATHPGSCDSTTLDALPDTTTARHLSEIRAEMRRLEELRSQWIAEVDDWDKRLAECRARLRRRNDGPMTLDSLATEYLRRISTNQWRHLRFAAHCTATVEDDAGRRTEYAQLDSGSRDQVYLAVCLAIVVAGERCGWHLPLVLNSAFTDYPSRSVRDAVEMLREFGHGRQVLCFTQHEHVVSVAHQLNVPVRSLVVRESNPVRHVASEPKSPPPTAPMATENRLAGPANTGFLLHEHDPIERAPSLDETNAARLRRFGVSRVGDLLRVDAAEIVAELRSSGLTPGMVDSWRAQALLVCRVRGLHPYDARILVACGIRDPEQLVQLQPGALRARVKEFAASAQGQAIIMSGTEYELSRLSDWIGAARDALAGSAAPPAEGHPRIDIESPSASRARRRHSRDATAAHKNASSVSSQDSRESAPTGGHDAAATVIPLGNSASGWRFHLSRSDSIANAPSIGPAMARRLEATGLRTIDDLLKANAESVAAQLGLRRVTRETIRQWQQQSELVCRVPRLRCHDAQFLVAAGIFNVEQLAAADPAALHRNIHSILTLPDGKRMLRGGKEPDLAEITEWIDSARHARALLAA